MLNVLVRDHATEYLDRIQRRLARTTLDRIRAKLQARMQDHWERIEALPFASTPDTPRRGGFAVKTGALRSSILNGIQITDRTVVAGSSLFYAGYVDALVRRKGIPEGLIPEIDWAREVASGILGDG